jgi:hypothetical protein
MSTPMPASGTTPVPPGAFADSGTSAGSTSASGGSLSTVFIEVIGVIVLALIAGIGPRVGKLTAIFMAGIMVIWAVTHATTLAKLLPGNNQES